MDLREDKNSVVGNGIHSYEIQKIKVLDEETPNTSNGVGTPNSELEGYLLANLLQKVEKSYDPGKIFSKRAKKRMLRNLDCQVDKGLLGQPLA